MKKSMILAAMLATLGFTLAASAVEDQQIPEDSLGLSKTSVFDSPEPPVVEYGKADPGSVGKRAERSYMTAPPMIPHNIEGMVPILQDTNVCKDCHVVPEMIGQKLSLGTPVPAPASHYENLKKGELYLGRWNCTQCHAPQAQVDVLVQSTFKKSGK